MKPSCLTCLSCERPLFHLSGRCIDPDSSLHGGLVDDQNGCGRHQPLDALGTKHVQLGAALGCTPSGPLVRCDPCAHMPGHFTLAGLGLMVTLNSATLAALVTAGQSALAEGGA